MSKKISELTAVTDVTPSDLFQVIDVEDSAMASSGTNKKVTAQTLGNYLPVRALGTTTSRTLSERFKDTVNVKDFGAAGDGIQDDTAAIQAFLTSGGGYIPAGTYSVESLTISNLVNVKCSNNAVIKKRSASSGSRVTLNFIAGSENSTWTNGIIDGNVSLYSSWSYAGIFNDWQGVFVGAENIQLNKITFKNWLNHPLVGSGNYLTAYDLTFESCATGPLFGWNFNATMTRPAGAGGIGQKVNGIVLKNVGDVGVAGTLQHMFDTYACKNGSYSNVSMINPNGSSTGLSYAISGWTDKLSESCAFSEFLFESPIGENVQHLAFSMLGLNNSTINNFVANNFSGLGLELLDVTKSSFSNIIIDCNYRATSVTSSLNNKGVSIDKGKYLQSGFLSRGISGTRNVSINNLNVVRAGVGIDSKTGNTIFSNCQIIGSIGTGIYIDETAATTSFPGAAKTYNTNILLNGCVSEFNGQQGLNVAEAGVVQVIGGSYSNNGQDSNYAATTRSGIAASIADRLTVIGSKLNDDQLFTVSNGASFIPGSTTNNRYEVSLFVPRDYSLGQNITLVNAGGVGINLTGKIINTDAEKVILEFPSAVSFVSTGNTSALTGTWSGSSTTLIGSGTAAVSQIVGPLYVNNGSEWRKVIRVAGDTSIIIEAPFSSSLSGSTLSKLETSVSGIVSQQYGARIFGSVNRSLTKGNIVNGNAVERILISNALNAEPSSEYWKKTTTNITGSGTNVDLLTGISRGQRLVGWTTLNSVAIAGGGVTNFALNYTNSAGTLKELLASNLSVSLNQRPNMNTQGTIADANDNKIVAVFSGGTPTSGQIILEAFIRSELPEVIPTV